MSKRSYVPDAERTALMVDLLRELHPIGGMSLSHVVLEEVAPGTGWSGSSRWADVLVLSCWPSKGQTLTGYEIKASKADLKRELADQSKHQRLARYCDAWWLVAWDESVLVDTVPADWGIMLTAEGEYGRGLEIKRKAAKRTPEPWPRQFVCSLVRNAFEQSPGMAYVERMARQTRDRALRDGRQITKRENEKQLEPLRDILFADKDHWMRPRDTETIIKAACDRLNQGILGPVGVERQA